MRTALRAGAAIFNAGYHHAAHDAWEDRWLELEAGTDDELLLHGLIQYTAAVYHAKNRNWAGAVGLAASAGEYLAPLSADHRAVDLEPVRDYLETLAADPEVIERRSPPRLVVADEQPSLESLTVEEIAVAAPVLGEDLGYPEDSVEHAAAIALADAEAGREDSTFIGLLYAFALEDDDRDVVYDRLTSHVDRRRSDDESVDELFDA